MPQKDKYMIRISQLKLPIYHTSEELTEAVRKALKCGNTPFTFRIRRQSLDARDKTQLKYVYTIDADVRGEKALLRRGGHNLEAVTEKRYRFPKPGTEPLPHRPIVVGSGPAGLFCAWYLANAGFRPLLLERGEDVDARKKTVEAFWAGGSLDPESNVQFGEGGAGTFSDGKLNTLVKDPVGRNREVLQRFVKAGAPEEILYQQKPHLGTDMLTGIVKNLRTQIISMGGEVRFRSRLTDLKIADGALTGVVVNDDEVIPAEVCVLAIGHSARDTFAMLNDRTVAMTPKAFAAGVRIEHPQTTVNRGIYGQDEIEILGPAAYKMTHKCDNGRGVYTFCMCPGGYVVNASSEEGRLAVNGMSYHDRASANANSAVIVTVTPEDFGAEGPLAGLAFQRRLEEAAYREGRGRVPVQQFGDFEKNSPSEGPGEIVPCIKGGYRWGNVRECLPGFISEAVCEGVHAFSDVIPGYDRSDAVIAGVESRTSSPVRITRGDSLEANYGGIYPCGEGAGYAGGITSAAMDGLKTAEAIAQKYASFTQGLHCI